MKPDFKLEFIKHNRSLRRLVEVMPDNPFFAVDLETVEWWDRSRERIALIQIAFKSKVAVIDALAPLDFDVLRKPFENNSIVKVIHNAAFDAVRIAKHYKIDMSPVHDTMLAARANGERQYSLKAQAAKHLGLQLDKSAQKSDWSRRPLDLRQISYAALDAHATLRLYEHQKKRDLQYDYRLKRLVSSEQIFLPLGEDRTTKNTAPADENVFEGTTANLLSAILGIVAELPTRFSPDSLAASLGENRTGLAGWIIDQRLGRETELDEETIRLAVIELCDRKLAQITDSRRRLMATEEGIRRWQTLKNKPLPENL